jgi:hypothetical protein
LNYALRNREEWELKGQSVVASMVERLEWLERPSSLSQLKLHN